MNIIIQYSYFFYNYKLNEEWINCKKNSNVGIFRKNFEWTCCYFISCYSKEEIISKKSWYYLFKVKKNDHNRVG